MILLLRADRVEAFLIADLLERSGIRAHIFNQNMASIVGDVPADAAMPQVWLDDPADQMRAEALLRDYRTDRNRDGNIYCRQCHEENPATFELCWNCGAVL